jgi:2-oxoisovalerate ferredoxin oxidoreductase beta subunit
MTGGQMAPPTLPGQKTTTTPEGRPRLAGEPLRMAEIVAQIDGPVYVERCALFNNKQRMRTHKAIRKGLRLQAENRGLSFIEVLSECPTHLKMTPTEAEKWVEENMTKYFPLGVKKDEVVEPWFDLGTPNFEPDRVIELIGATDSPAERFSTEFPSHLDERDIEIKFAGAGGDGAQTIAMLTTKTAIDEGWDSTHIPSYGPESRGGTSYAVVHIARDEVLSPSAPHPHLLVAFNAPSLDKFGPTVRKGGIVVYDSSVVQTPPTLDESIRMVGVPCSGIAQDLNKRMVKNVVALGAMQAASGMFTPESFLTTLRRALKANCAVLELNEVAFARGREACQQAAPAG